MSLRYKGGVISATPPTLTASVASGSWTLQQQMQAIAAGTWPTLGAFIEDVFSTYLYDGNDSTQTITNGIDLSDKGGMVWIKNRSVATTNNLIFDTARGTNKEIRTNLTNPQSTGTDLLTAFNSNGFTLGAGGTVNAVPAIFSSWTFRKQAKFFDVVTYTGDGIAGRTVSHNLGSIPGCIIVKATSGANAGSVNWAVYHRSLGNTKRLALNTTDGAITSATGEPWNSTSPTSTVFTVNNDAKVNAADHTYVAYLFAHDAGGFGPVGTDNAISCGSYTGNGSATGPTITLGYEPQWVLIKNSTSDSTNNWVLFDNARGIPVNGESWFLVPNSDNAESSGTTWCSPTATGFKILSTDGNVNISSNVYVYIAIRRGPMRTPTDATKVFTPTVYTGTNVDNRLINTTIAPDMVWIRQRDSTTVAGMVVGDRLRGQPYLLTGTTDAEVNDSDAFDAYNTGVTEKGTAFASMNGVWVGNDATAQLNASTTASNQIAEAFKRAPGFFDVVCYTGTGVARTVNHNLGVVPELMIVKSRSSGLLDWVVYSAPTGNANALLLNTTDASFGSTSWGSTTPTASVFSTGASGGTNNSGATFVAYLFATCPGVSKVGSYTGNGTTQTINCGFSSSARFILIKRTDTTGNWYVFDSARGIVTGVNDPYIGLNLTSAEATDDCVGTNSSGFTVTDSTPTFINVNTATYIFLAIA